MTSAYPNDRITFWFPVLLPILMGLILAFAELVADLAATAIVMDHGENRNIGELIAGDFSKLWLASSKNIGSAVFAIDIWALTTLFVARITPRTPAVYAYPVLGIFLHFILLLTIVGVGYLADAFDAAVAAAELAAAAASEGMEIPTISADPDTDKLLATLMRVIASATMILAVIVGWAVRRGIWIHHDSAFIEPADENSG